jgi:PAS domain S-box-containing protein
VALVGRVALGVRDLQEVGRDRAAVVLGEPAADLGIALAIASSFRDMPVDPKMVAIGEIGLSGELRSVAQLDRRVTEAAFEGLAVTEGGILIDVSEMLAKLFGYQKSALIGKPIAELIAPYVRDETLTKILSGYSRPYESVCLKSDGTIFPVEVCGKNYSSKGRALCIMQPWSPK